MSAANGSWPAPGTAPQDPWPGDVAGTSVPAAPAMSPDGRGPARAVPYMPTSPRGITALTAPRGVTAPSTPPSALPTVAERGSVRLQVDWPNCRAHKLCHELLPEIIGLDEWGYPLLADGPVPPELAGLARRAADACPTLALRVTPAT